MQLRGLLSASKNNTHGGCSRFYSIDINKEIKRWKPAIPIASASTPPSSWYTSQEFFEYEKEHVFKKNWLWVGDTEDTKLPQSFITGDYLGEPYLISRDDNNDLNAMYNVCRHHGATLVDEKKGTRKEFVCPYHGWTYALDGKLKKAVRVTGIKDFSAKDYCLKPIKLGEWAKWQFLCFDEPRFKLDKFNELSALIGLDKLENEYVFVHSHMYTVHSNWKVYVENYCDGGYHVPILHTALNALLDMTSYKTDLYDNFSTQSVGGRETNEGEKNRVGDRGIYAYLYPNLMINKYGEWIDVNVCFPISPTETAVLFQWYHRKSTYVEGSEIETSLKSSNVVQEEDDYISKKVQIGLSSGGYDTGRYAPEVEQAAYHFHQILYKDLCRD